MLSSLGEFSGAFGTELAQPDARALRGQAAATRKAYHRACLRLHPDRQVGASESTQALALALFQSLSAAFVAAQPNEPDLSC